MKERFHIFLDYNGVLTNWKYAKKMEEEKGIDVFDSGDIICPESANALVSLIERLEKNFEVQIVFASAKRREATFGEAMYKMFRAGIKHAFAMDRTPIGDMSHRGKEIKAYINKRNVENYVVIDDDIDKIVEEIPGEYIIHTDLFESGLTKENVDNFLSEFELNYQGDLAK